MCTAQGWAPGQAYMLYRLIDLSDFNSFCNFWEFFFKTPFLPGRFISRKRLPPACACFSGLATTRPGVHLLPSGIPEAGPGN